LFIASDLLRLLIYVEAPRPIGWCSLFDEEAFTDIRRRDIWIPDIRSRTDPRIDHVSTIPKQIDGVTIGSRESQVISRNGI